MTLSYRGLSYELTATRLPMVVCETTGQYRGSHYPIRHYAAMPQIAKVLKYRGIAYVPGAAHSSTSTDGGSSWQPAIA
jgi:hypothetical protein